MKGESYATTTLHTPHYVQNILYVSSDGRKLTADFFGSLISLVRLLKQNCLQFQAIKIWKIVVIYCIPCKCGSIFSRYLLWHTNMSIFVRCIVEVVAKLIRPYIPVLYMATFAICSVICNTEYRILQKTLGSPR